MFSLSTNYNYYRGTAIRCSNHVSSACKCSISPILIDMNNTHAWLWLKFLFDIINLNPYGHGCMIVSYFYQLI